MATRASLIWIDFNGHTRQTLLRGTNLATIAADLRAKSNAAFQDSWQGAGSGAVGTPTAATYQSVGDSAVLTYADATGELTYITLPAPQSGIFLADQETVDATKIAALTAAVVGNIMTSSGGLVTAFIGGVRRARLREYQ